MIISDFHAGDGSRKDDLLHNSELTLAVLEDYYQRGYRMILNGDIEERQKFLPRKIRQQWNDMFALFSRFHAEGRLVRIVGNHDLDLLYQKDLEIPVCEGVRYSLGENEIFIFHGHQASRFYAVFNDHVGLILRYILAFLPFKNLSVSHDNRKRKKLEERVYSFSTRKQVVSIIGHTHRPLFESLSKTDYVKYNIERLCRQYTSADPQERLSIEGEIRDLKQHLSVTVPDQRKDFGSIYHEEFVVPGMFNSGCVLGKRGITCIELDRETISLMYWFDKNRSRRYLRYENYETQRLEGTPFYSAAIKSEQLDYIFTRLRLLA